MFNIDDLTPGGVKQASILGMGKQTKLLVGLNNAIVQPHEVLNQILLVSLKKEPHLLSNLRYVVRR